MKKFLYILFLFAGCSFTPDSPLDLMIGNNNLLRDSLEDKSRRYPFFNVKFADFVVSDEDPNDPKATPEQKARARRIDVLEKKLMLQKIDLIRFTVNTPEFASNLMKGVFKANRDMIGPNGTIKVGDVYDNKRLLEVLQRRTAPFRISKQLIDGGAAAVAPVGAPAYVLDDNDPANDTRYYIAFPNREYWGESSYLHNPVYLAAVVFHELLHNIGFTHGEIDHDTVYGIQGVLSETISQPGFTKKYKKKLDSYRYYETLHAALLLTDTGVVKKAYSHDHDHRDHSTHYHASIDSDSDEEVIVCIVHPDGTHTLKKMKESELHSL